MDTRGPTIRVGGVSPLEGVAWSGSTGWEGGSHVDESRSRGRGVGSWVFVRGERAKGGVVGVTGEESSCSFVL